jgi:glycosyltransferase involved in cell wall biosynthesis
MPGAARPPLVAVIVPCFNQGVYLAGAVASVQAQTHGNLEIVVVDDGSTDDSLQVARALASRSDGRVRVIARENGGLPVARNTGIAATSAEYVCCLDADDELTPTYLERCVAALEREPARSIAYGGQQNFGEDQTFHPHHPFDLRQHLVSNLLGVASVFRRRAWADAGGYPSMDSYEDWSFWIACCERGHLPLHVPDATFRYRVRSGSMYDEATRRDVDLKARIVADHPDVYAPTQLRWAHAVRAGDPAARAVPAPLGRVPLFADGAGWEPPATPVPPVQPVELGDVRPGLLCALHAELVDDPSLLRLYTEAIPGDAPVTLVVLAPGADATTAIAGLRRAADAARVDLDGPDLLLVTEELAPERLRTLSFRLDGFVSRKRPPQDLAVAPRLDSPSALAAVAREQAAA